MDGSIPPPSPVVDNDWWPPFSPGEYAERHARVRAAMTTAGLDCLVVYGRVSLPGTGPGAQNMAYLANYGPAYDGYVVFPRDGAPTLFPWPLFHVANARKLSCIGDVRAGADLITSVVERLQELLPGAARVGVVGNYGMAGRNPWSLPHEHWLAIAAALPYARLEVVTDWFELHRVHMSDEELAFLRRGSAITERAVRAVRGALVPGVRYGDVFDAGLREIHAAGGRSAFGHVGGTPMDAPTAGYPDFYATRERLADGDAVMAELSAGYGSYCGKLMATFFTREPTAEYRALFERAADAYRALRDAVRPGATGAELEAVLAAVEVPPGCRSLSFADGWSTYHTPPSLHWVPVPDADRRFELFPGLSLTLCGWIAGDALDRGAWVAKTVLVTDDGCEELEGAPIDQLEFAVLDRAGGGRADGLVEPRAGRDAPGGRAGDRATPVDPGARP